MTQTIDFLENRLRIFAFLLGAVEQSGGLLTLGPPLRKIHFLSDASLIKRKWIGPKCA